MQTLDEKMQIATLYMGVFLTAPPPLNSASKKVLNSGLGPFKDQTAEMVLSWSFFGPFFTHYDYNALFVTLSQVLKRQLASNCRVGVID